MCYCKRVIPVHYRTDDTCATVHVRHATADRSSRALPTRGHARPRVHRAGRQINNCRARSKLYYSHAESKTSNHWGRSTGVKSLASFVHGPTPTLVLPMTLSLCAKNSTSSRMPRIRPLTPLAHHLYDVRSKLPPRFRPILRPTLWATPVKRR